MKAAQGRGSVTKTPSEEGLVLNLGLLVMLALVLLGPADEDEIYAPQEYRQNGQYKSIKSVDYGSWATCLSSSY